MTEQHPITPPPELIDQWKAEIPTGIFDGYKWPQREIDLCIQAARWGADQELEACCNYFEDHLRDGIAKDLRTARRPKPQSLKEQALTALSEADQGLNKSEWQQRSDTIRRALEALPDD